MISDIADQLHTFFVPQMEQLGLVEQSAKHGSLSTVDAEWGTGMLWAYGIDENCLFTFHDLHLSKPIRLTEFPAEYICITSITASSAKLCPVESRYLRERNTVSFRQAGGSVSFTLNPGEHHCSYTLCMTPRFFDKIGGLDDNQKDMLVNHLCSSDTNTHCREARLALESMDPSWANKAGGNLFCEGKVREIIAYLLDDAAKETQEDAWSVSSEEHRLAREAQMIIDERFAENLTLQSIAKELYVGKTKLCSLFKKQVGSCVVEYLRERRLTEARRLLETTDMKTTEIGHVVGYAHSSSFTDAFKRAFGTSPSRWRECAGATTENAPRQANLL